MKYMKILMILFFVGLVSGCAGLEYKTTPPSPIEVQLLTQIVTKRTVAKDLAPNRKEAVLKGLAVAKTAVSSPDLDINIVIQNLSSYLGPENSDIAALLVLMIHDRVQLQNIPTTEQRPYILAVLTGVEAGLK